MTLHTQHPVLAVHDLQVGFGSKTGIVNVVNGVSYEIAMRETLGIVGESGCGKSVTAQAIMGILGPRGHITGGSVHFKGEDLLGMKPHELQAVRGARIAMIFQEPMTALNPVYTIGFQIDEQIACHQLMSAKDAREKTIEMLRLAGIPSPEIRYRSYPHQLSGGMRQRAMIAMALSCEPELLIADEPTTALDVTIQAQILDLIEEMQDRFGMAVQFISHDLGIISEIADRVIVMYAGMICEVASTQEVLSNPAHPYTLGLLGSIPQFDRSARRLPTIRGSVPVPENLPSGCPFHNRCDFASDRCTRERPQLEGIGVGRSVACHHPSAGQ